MRPLLIAALLLPCNACIYVSDAQWLDRVDADRDGFVSVAVGGSDCNDGDVLINTSATEICNGIDDDCDGTPDDRLLNFRFLRDADGDGFGDPGDELVTCAPPEGYVQVDEGAREDCDDSDQVVNPNANEVWYDGVDQDCDGWSDHDQDRDGFDNIAAGGRDCDDEDADRNPDAQEIWYDGVDQNCDGQSDFDQDGDGFDVDEDCDDTAVTVFPGAVEVWYNGIDEDCSGGSDYDQDGDSAIAALGFGADCDDLNPDAYPGAPEVWYDGIDQDCGEDDDFDQDGDGFQAVGEAPEGDDCDDTTDNVNPDQGETCNGRDDDCNGLVDDIDEYWRDADGDGAGVPSEVVLACTAVDGFVKAGDEPPEDCDDANPLVYPGAPVVCGDWIDNDCGTDKEVCIQSRPIWPNHPFNGNDVGEFVGPAGDVDDDGSPDLWAGGGLATEDGSGVNVFLNVYRGPFEDGGWAQEVDKASLYVSEVRNYYQMFQIDEGGDGDLEVVAFLPGQASSGPSSDPYPGHLWLFDLPRVGDSPDLLAAARVDLLTGNGPADLSAVEPLRSVAQPGAVSFGTFGGEWGIAPALPRSSQPMPFATVSGSLDTGHLSFISDSQLADVDGDGVEDLTIGSSWGEGFYNGNIFLVPGPLPSVFVAPADAVAILRDPSGQDGVGEEICLTDFTGDGRLEVLTGGADGGRPHNWAFVGAFPEEGAAFADNVMTVELSSYRFSRDVQINCPGDMNADGVGDIVVGHPYENNFGGIVAAIFGPGPTGVDFVQVGLEYSQSDAPGYVDLVVQGDSATVNGLGAKFATIGDIDGNGGDDLLARQGDPQLGAVGMWIFRGPGLQ